MKVINLNIIELETFDRTWKVIWDAIDKVTFDDTYDEIYVVINTGAWGATAGATTDFINELY